MPAGSSTPNQHGRFRLDDPREDAEHLLDAALSGNRRSLARIAVHRLTPVSERPVLRDALHTVSQEMGFQGWDHFQRHVGALDEAAEQAGGCLDNDLDTVHILRLGPARYPARQRPAWPLCDLQRSFLHRPGAPL